VKPFAGCIDISPGWFMQGQEVCTITTSVRDLIMCIQRLEDDLHPSEHLASPEIANFLKKMGPAQDLLNGILAVVSPDLFKAGRDAIEMVKKMELHENARLWTSVYTAMSVIVNRMTPRHRDVGAAIAHPDLLLSAGEHVGSEFHIPDIGVVLEYNPGTVVVIAGRVLSHAVPRHCEGWRVCIAQYMKDKVHDRVGVGRPPLMEISAYDSLKADGYLQRVEQK
jgi:hypothetical protein